MTNSSGHFGSVQSTKESWVPKFSILLMLILAVVLPLSAAAAPGDTIRVSLSTAGGEGNGESFDPAVSSDGRYVAFASDATNLVSGDTNGARDVFLHDTRTGETSRISVSTAGDEGDGDSDLPAISSDGLFIVFESEAANLVADDTNGTKDIFLYDVINGTTRRVSVSSAGLESNDGSGDPEISGDGRFIAFVSGASNLVSGDSNGFSDIFLHDTQTGGTVRVSVDSAGLEGDDVSVRPDLSVDGRYIVFQSAASNLVMGDTNNERDIFFHDVQTQSTSRVSLASDGGEGDGFSNHPVISADGQFVVFASQATNLVPDDMNDLVDVFLHDTNTGETRRVSLSSSGEEGNGNSSVPSISDDGTYISFISGASNLVAGDVCCWDAFVHKVSTGKTIKVSVSSAGMAGNSTTYHHDISGDGSFIAFGSDSTNLVSGDTNGVRDIFLHEMKLPEMDVQGNGQSISAGDDTPAVVDGTDFGDVNLDGATAVGTFTIENTGDEELYLTGSPMIAISGAHAADFTITNQPSSPVVASGGTTTFEITFDPSAAGLREAEISIANDDSDEDPYNFAIQGTGTEPEMDVQGQGVSIPDGDATPSTTDDTDFGGVAVEGMTLIHTFTVVNKGNLILHLKGTPKVEVTGTNAEDFTITSQPVSPVAPDDGTTTFEITFDPSAAGLREAEVSIANDDSDEDPYIFAVQGTGLAPEMDVQGQGVSIPDGDATPSATDDTDFGGAAVGGDAVIHTFTVENTGDADLHLTGTPIVEITGTHAADFTVTSSPLTPVAASGGTTTFEITFDPSAAGLREAEISIANDDSDENPYNFAIQGTGTAPEINVEGGGISISDGDITPDTADKTDFGDIAVDGAVVVHEFTIKNTGTADLNLTGSPLVDITGTHAADFTVTSSPSTPVPAGGGTTTFDVTFDPGDEGLREAEISIGNTDSNENPYNFTVQGTGLVPAPEMDVQGQGVSILDGDATPSATDDTDFGGAAVGGDAVIHTFTVENTGDADLHLTGTPIVEITGTHAADFTVTSSPLTPVAASGGTTTFEITFDPSAAGLREAEISIANDDSDENPYNFAIQGTGTAPEINVEGGGISISDGDITPDTADKTDFGDIAVDGAVVVHEFTIKNTGTADLNLTGSPLVDITGTHAADFTVTSSPSTPVPAGGGTTTFDVTFDPGDEGLREAQISITNDDSDEDLYNFAVQGTGTGPEINVQYNGTSIPDGDASPGSGDGTDFGETNAAFGIVVHTFTVENTGGAPLSLTGTPLVDITGSHAGDFTVTSPPASTVAGGGPTTFEITFDPADVGLREAQISIANDDSDENPYNFAIQGTGTVTFSDVLPDHWAFDWVESLSYAGLTAGYPDGTYRPGNPVTRAEMAVFLLKGMNSGTYTPPDTDGSHPFSDIAGHWAEAWMEDLYDEGLTSGYPDGTYRPQNEVTRAEMAVFLLKSKHGAGYSPPSATGGVFSDVVGHWAEDWIEQLAEEGITGGYPDGTYRPNNPVNRAEMAVFLVNAFGIPLP